MKIGWIADFNQLQRSGGAQLTDRYVIDNLRSKGHEVREVNIANVEHSLSVLKGIGFFVIGNFVELYQTKIGRELLEQIVNDFEFIRFCHDYDGARPVEYSFRKQMFEKAIKFYFLSPLHKKVFLSEYKLDEATGNTALYVPYIDSRKFRLFNPHEARLVNGQKTYIALGEFGQHKGSDNLFQYANAQKIKIDYYTWQVKEKLVVGNVNLLPKVDYENIPLYLNKYSHFVHLPEWQEPFGRTYAEAFLCGCEIITIKDSSGFRSWNFNNRSEMVDVMRSSLDKFLDFNEKV